MSILTPLVRTMGNELTISSSEFSNTDLTNGTTYSENVESVKSELDPMIFPLMDDCKDLSETLSSSVRAESANSKNESMDIDNDNNGMKTGDDQSTRKRFRTRKQSMNYRLKWPTHILVESNNATPRQQNSNSETSSIASSAGSGKRRGRKRIYPLEQSSSPSPSIDGLSSNGSVNGSIPTSGRGGKRRKRVTSLVLNSPAISDEVDPLCRPPPSFPLPNLHNLVNELLTFVSQSQTETASGHVGIGCPFSYTWDEDKSLKVNRVELQHENYMKSRLSLETQVDNSPGKRGKRNIPKERPIVSPANEPLPKVLARKVSEKGHSILLTWDSDN